MPCSMQQKGILHRRSMRRARSARLFLLAIGVVARVPGVVKGQVNQGGGSNPGNIYLKRCACTNQPRCTVGDCGNYEYCNNVGNQVNSDNNFLCQQCEHGSYYKKHTMLQPYQTVKTLPRSREVYQCTDREGFMLSPDKILERINYCLTRMDLKCLSDSDCVLVPEPIPGTETTLQACQHCPILTVANTPYLFPKDEFFQDTSLIRTEEKLIVPRCFASCYEAWVQGVHTPATVYIPVLTADGVRYNNVDLFPEVEGDRVKSAPPPQILQSVVTFSHPEVGDWLKTEEAGWYSTYLRSTKMTGRFGGYNQRKITSLPAPRRQCRMCPVGKTMLLAPRLDPQAFAIWSANLNALRDGLVSKVGSQQNFAHEISWLNNDALADFETVGICAPCPAGTYFNDAKANLAATVVGSTERLDVIKRMNAGRSQENQLLAQWTLKQLRCVPCEEGTFRSDNYDVGICRLVEDEDVAILDEVDLRWQAEPGAQLRVSKTLLARRVLSCPVASEKKYLDKTCALAATEWDSLASSVENKYVQIKKNDCCVPCAVNFYKTSTQKMCTNVDSNKATAVPYGSMQQIVCARGTELRACREKNVEDGEAAFNPNLADFCQRTEFMRDEDWRVCLPCTAVARPVVHEGEARCVMCNDEDPDASGLASGLASEPLGEFYNATTGACEACDECAVFEPAVEWRAFFAGAAGADYRAAMGAWLDTSSRIDSYRVRNRWHYKHFGIANACKPLRRRTLAWDAGANTGAGAIRVDGEDRVKAPTRERWKGQLRGEGPLAAWHAVDYERYSDGARRCVALRCEQHCVAWYHYSQGCGAGAARAARWAQAAETGAAGGGGAAGPASGAWRPRPLAALEAELRALAAGGGDAAGALARWQLKHHGHCVLCTLCADGQYNPGCNRFAEGVPEGRCEACATQCAAAPASEFLWHAGGLRGCAPLVPALKGQVLTDYVCRRCPTWVRRAQRMYAVLGCGNAEAFGFWRAETLEPQAVTLTRAQALAKAAFEHPEVEVRFKPFHHLAPYCPDGYFFDEQAKDCGFRSESAFRLHRADVDSFGFEAYRLECCRLCARCDSDRFRMMAQYAACTGESMQDTQARGCGDRCESGFYVRNETVLECVECTEC